MNQYLLLEEDKFRKVFDVTISAATVLQKEDESLLSFAERNPKSEVFNGLRSNKISAELIRAQLVRKSHNDFLYRIKSEVLTKTVDSIVQEICRTQDIRLVTSPEVDLVSSFDTKDDVKLKLTLNLWPHLPEVDLSKVTINTLDVFISPDDIAVAQQTLLRQNADHANTDADYLAQKDDVVTIDFDGQFENDAGEFEVIQGGSAKDYKLELGSNRFISGFEDQIIGHKSAEKFDILITFPNDYAQKDLSGKKAKFTIQIHKIEKIVLPELNETFFKKMGFSSLDELKNSIKMNMQNFYGSQIRNIVKKDVMEKLSTILDFELPPVLLSRREEEIATQERSRNDRRTEGDQKTDSEILDYARAEAARELRLSFYIIHHAEKHNIKVEENDVVSAVMDEARYTGHQNVSETFKYYRENPKAMESLRNHIQESKVYESIYNKITLEKKIIARQDFDEAMNSGKLSSLLGL